MTDHFTIQPVPQFAMQAVGLYEETEFGGPNSRQRWASVGARPIFFFNDRFSVALIPHTLTATTLGSKQPGASVNLETDLLAKYVWKYLHGGGVTLETLREAGFVRRPEPGAQQ